MHSRSFIILIVLVLAGTAIAQAPKIEVSPKEWNFGVHTQGEFDRTTIKVKNVGNAVLKLEKLDVTCGCVIPKLLEDTIPPGGEVDLLLELDTRRGEGGAIDKKVVIKTNDPSQRILHIPTRGHINRVWWVNNRNINVGKIPNGKETTRTFRVHVRKGHDVKIKGITTSHTELKIERKPFKAANGVTGWDISVTFPANMESLEYWEGQILIESDFKPIPYIGLRLFGEIRGNIEITPNRLVFGSMKPGESKTLTLRVEKTKGVGMSIANLHCSDDAIKMEHVEKEAGKSYEIRVTLTPKEEGSLRGRIHAAINEPGQKVHVIDFTARVKK